MDRINNMLEKQINEVVAQQKSEASEKVNEEVINEEVTKEPISDEELMQSEYEINEESEINKEDEITAADYVDSNSIEARLDRIESVLVTLTESHDSLCSNIQTAVLASMQASQTKVRKKSEKAKRYTSEQEDTYKALLAHFTESTNKTQRDLTNGVNQLIASSHGYSVGKPSGCAASEHILAKVAKDHEIDPDKHLSIEGYLDSVNSYVQFITQTLPNS